MKRRWRPSNFARTHHTPHYPILISSGYVKIAIEHGHLQVIYLLDMVIFQSYVNIYLWKVVMFHSYVNVVPEGRHGDFLRMPMIDLRRRLPHFGKLLFSPAACLGEWMVIPPVRCWLVVYLPLWKIWHRQLGWWTSQHMEKLNSCSKPPTRFNMLLCAGMICVCSHNDTVSFSQFHHTVWGLLPG